jgi:hypothetical protein
VFGAGASDVASRGRAGTRRRVETGLPDSKAKGAAEAKDGQHGIRYVKGDNKRSEGLPRGEQSRRQEDWAE